MNNIYSEIREERIRQDNRWGGATHDDEHTATSDGACWRRFMERQIALADCEHAQAEKNSRTEAYILLSLIRRLKGPGVRGRATAAVRAYENDEHGKKINPTGTAAQSE